MIILQLRAAGAHADRAVLDAEWPAGAGSSDAGPEQLYRTRAVFEAETPPAVAPDVIIAVGAEASALPPHIVRGEHRQLSLGAVSASG